MDGNFRPAKLFGNANKMIEAYHVALQPICKETGIPPLALDILLFIANNPENATAKEICKFRGFKSGIVSVHIERMAAGGLIERAEVPEDRRKTLLKATEEAQPIVERGRDVQKKFGERLLTGLTEEDISAVRSAMRVIEGNIENILKNGL